jgi:hypothetical protein
VKCKFYYNDTWLVYGLTARISVISRQGQYISKVVLRIRVEGY